MPNPEYFTVTYTTTTSDTADITESISYNHYFNTRITSSEQEDYIYGDINYYQYNLEILNDNINDSIFKKKIKKKIKEFPFVDWCRKNYKDKI